MLYAADHIGAYGACEDVFIAVLREASTLESLRDLRRGATRHHARWKGRGRSLTVIEPQEMRLFVPEPIRRESAALTADFPSLATAIVIEGDGFAVAAMRSFVAGIYLVSAGDAPHRIFGDVPDAARWLAKASGSALPVPGDVVGAVERTRASIPPPPA